MSWRGRIGLVYPADGAIDDEYWRFVPPGVTVHITRIPATDEQHVAVFEAQADSPDIETAARHLTAIPMDAIAYACTAGSFIYGGGKDLEIIRRMEAACGVPCTTTSTALVRAAKRLGLRKLAVAAPYPDPVSERLRAFLGDNGLEVVSTRYLGLEHGIYKQPVGAAYQLARAADVAAAEAVVISCTNFRTAGLLQAMEADLGKPVLSANQATMWHALGLAGIDPRQEGLGSLFRLGPAG
jgi:maleate isomerase